MGARRAHRSPATTSSFHAGRPPPNKGQRYPADPPTGALDHRGHARRRQPARRDPAARPDRRAVARGLRISEALSLGETDLDGDRGSILVRRGGGKRREVGMDRWGWEHWNRGSCRGSTARRSSTPCTRDARRRSQPPPGFIASHNQHPEGPGGLGSAADSRDRSGEDFRTGESVPLRSLGVADGAADERACRIRVLRTQAGPRRRRLVC
jgi:hypothetical protein